jgi:antitoxin component YwqK of YwqJK toxin-antitoxin module
MKRFILLIVAGLAVDLASTASACRGAELPSIFSGTPSKSSRPANRPAESKSAAKPAKYSPPPFEVKLPSDRALTQALMNLPPDWTKKLFPQDELVYARKYPSDKVQGAYTFSQAKLNGPAAVLYEDGGLSMLANYAMSDREGPLRRWEENKKRLLYAEYKRDKKHGAVCLFREDLPWFVQDYDMGEVTAEYLVKWKDGAAEAVPREKLASDDLRETATARTRLTELEANLERNEAEVKKALREWFWEKDKEIKQKRVAKQSGARRDEQRKKQQQGQKNVQAYWRNALRSAGF